VHYFAKHAARKRRSIKARFAGIGVAGAATIAAGVATANEAKAASIWDTVAQCETGQNWATNSVPGYSGGLGFANRYWAAFGGTQYSALPYQATREQQIAVAQRILATNGPTAWPVCGPRAGLTKANGGAATTAAAPAAAAPSTSRSTTRTAPKATTTTTTKATAPKAAPKAAAKPAAKPANTAPAVSGNTVTVKAGDTLSELALKLGVKGGWKALYAANTNLVKNPNLIYVGQVLRLPA
jgi:LysM repeat protein